MSPTYRKRQDVVTRHIAGETLLVPIRASLAGIEAVFVLDSDVARLIWQQLDAAMSLEALRDAVLANFEVSEESAESDVRDFVGQLLEAGLIVEAG